MIKKVFITILVSFFLFLLFITQIQKAKNDKEINKIKIKFISNSYCSTISFYEFRGDAAFIEVNKKYFILKIKNIKGDLVGEIKKGDSIFKEKDSTFFIIKRNEKQAKFFLKD